MPAKLVEATKPDLILYGLPGMQYSVSFEKTVHIEDKSGNAVSFDFRRSSTFTRLTSVSNRRNGSGLVKTDTTLIGSFDASHSASAVIKSLFAGGFESGDLMPGPVSYTFTLIDELSAAASLQHPISVPEMREKLTRQLEIFQPRALWNRDETRQLLQRGSPIFTMDPRRTRVYVSLTAGGHIKTIMLAPMLPITRKRHNRSKALNQDDSSKSDDRMHIRSKITEDSIFDVIARRGIQASAACERPCCIPIRPLIRDLFSGPFGGVAEGLITYRVYLYGTQDKDHLQQLLQRNNFADGEIKVWSICQVGNDRFCATIETGS